MNAKKYIYVDAYKQKNLGDDLFLAILFQRYKDLRFLLRGSKDYKRNLRKYRNVRVMTARYENFINHMVFPYRHHKKNFIGSVIQNCKASVYIGGSIFQEPNIPMLMDSFVNENSFVIGSNFGPCETKYYHDRIEEILKQMTNVCFRDQWSYEQFSSLKNVSYAADVLFGVDRYYPVKPKETKQKQLFLSVMDFSVSHLELSEFMPAYVDFMVKRIREAVKNQIGVTLSSFCKPEGDEAAVDKILSRLSAGEADQVSVVNYDGSNAEEVLQAVADSDVVIGTRFHSIIFGLLYGKKVIPVCYSTKHEKLLRDLGIGEEEILSVRDLKENAGKLHVCRLTKEKIKELQDSAQLQFRAFDMWRER